MAVSSNFRKPEYCDSFRFITNTKTLAHLLHSSAALFNIGESKKRHLVLFITFMYLSIFEDILPTSYFFFYVAGFRQIWYLHNMIRQ